MSDHYTFAPIGWVESVYQEKFGTPRQSGVTPSATGIIHFYPPYDREEYTRGLSGFTHLWILGVFHEIPASESREARPMVRPPKLGGNKKVGVFASRSPFRPNPISLSVVKVESIQLFDNKTIIGVSGLDLIQDTPILDLKPYLPYADSRPKAETPYGQEAKELLPMTILNSASVESLSEQEWNLVQEVISAQPAPGYHLEDGNPREYGFLILNFNVKWVYENGEIVLTELKRKIDN